MSRTNLSVSLVVLAILMVSGSATAQGQLWQTRPLMRLPAPASTTQTAPSIGGYTVSNRFSAGAPSTLADRVAELEKQLEKFEEEAKRKEEAAEKEEDEAKREDASKPSVTAGGRLQLDWAAFDQNAAGIAQAGDALNGTEFRRARIYLKGDAFHNIDYKIQFDFTGQTDFKDVYVTLKELPWLGNFRVGHFKEPWSLEEQTSSRFITFMERSLANAFSPGRNIGLMAFDWSENERITWAIGAFAQVNEDPPEFPPPGFDDAGGTAGTMRLTWLPWYDEPSKGRRLLHLGLSCTYRDIAELLPDAPAGTTRYRLRSRPEAHLAPYIVSTGDIPDVDHVWGMNAETAWVHGPFSAQSEYVWWWVDRNEIGLDPPTAAFDGGYVQLSYFLTGEHRTYDRHRGKFKRVKPRDNFFRLCRDGRITTGFGAWEVAYRWSYLNLSDAGIRGGRAVDHAFGLNWYLNPYTRVMFNYVHSQIHDTSLLDGSVDRDTGGAGGTGELDAVMCRVMIDL